MNIAGGLALGYLLLERSLGGVSPIYVFCRDGGFSFESDDVDAAEHF
jgi:hypothetical protein